VGWVQRDTVTNRGIKDTSKKSVHACNV
jgi:hypothetical protein